jgi:hypothetical protein
MNVSFDDIENAFYFVSSDQKFMNNAILCMETGRIFYFSALVGSEDELRKTLRIPLNTLISHIKTTLVLEGILSLNSQHNIYPKR